MKKIKTFNWKVAPIIGAGAFIDYYRKEYCGMDGWSYTIILPFLMVRFGVIYITNSVTPKE